MEKFRGRKIYVDNNLDCKYLDDDSYVRDTWMTRPCGVCNKVFSNLELRHDPCIENLPNVVNACCGHGEMVGAYVMFEDLSIVRNEEAIAFMRSVGKNPPANKNHQRCIGMEEKDNNTAGD